MSKIEREAAKDRYMARRGTVKVVWVGGNSGVYPNATVPMKPRSPRLEYEKAARESDLLYFQNDEDIIWVNTIQVLEISWSPVKDGGGSK